MDSILVLFIVYTIPDINVVEKFYLTEQYLYHRSSEIMKDTKNEIYYGSSYIDFYTKEEFEVDETNKVRAFSGYLTNDDFDYYRDSPDWDYLETKDSIFMGFPAIVEYFKFTKIKTIQTEIYADIPLFRKYQEKIHFQIGKGFINSRAGKFNLRVLSKSYFSSVLNHESNVLEEQTLTPLKLEKIEEIKVPADFFTKLKEFPIVDIKTIENSK